MPVNPLAGILLFGLVHFSFFNDLWIFGSAKEVLQRFLLFLGLFSLGKDIPIRRHIAAPQLVVLAPARGDRRRQALAK